jgi:hypothetical protein
MGPIRIFKERRIESSIRFQDVVDVRQATQDGIPGLVRKDRLRNTKVEQHSKIFQLEVIATQ